MPQLDAVPLAVETGLGFELPNLMLVLVAAWVAGRVAERVGYPGVLGELLAGVLLGPPLLGLLSAGEGLAVLGNLGIVLMMLYIGMEIDFDDLRRASRAGLLAAIGGFVVPAVLGYLVVIAFGGDMLAGPHALLGSFVGGMFIRKDLLGERNQHEVEAMLRDVSIGFLAPVFFVTAGFQITFGVFQTDLALLAAVVGVAMIGKIVGTALFYIPSGHGWREGMVVGFGMNGRGAVEIVVAGIGLGAGLITPELFTILVFMAIATTATVPVLMTAGVRWLRNRGELARGEERRQAVVIIGAGAVARLLASELALHRAVRLVDSTPDRCELVRSQGLEAIRGDVLDPDTLEEAHLGEARTVLALTTNSEVNVLAAQLVRHDFHVPHVAVAAGASTTPTLQHLLERIGAEPLWEDHTDLVHWDHLVATGRALPSPFDRPRMARSSGDPQGLDRSRSGPRSETDRPRVVPCGRSVS